MRVLNFTIFLSRFYFLLALFIGCSQQNANESTISYVGDGWARNSINTVIFRKNSLTSREGVQYISYYDPEGYVVLGKRNQNEASWQTKTTQYKGSVQDAHNSISIEVDGEGFLHISWGHHNSRLRYAKSITPGSLELGKEISMTGSEESVVSYPEFYRLPDGNLLFFYRDGGSGNGNLVINKYQVTSRAWKRLQDNLIDGEGQRNPYWQACIHQNGTIHISWVWRESPDVASNNDMCYARSIDGGITWQKSNGTKYELPITKSTAEVIHNIPMNSDLINQTSMATNANEEPYVISYWKPEHTQTPQYQLLYLSGSEWKVENLGFRSQPFSLSGIGTKQIPISRPQVLTSKSNKVYVIFRDAERNNRVSIAENTVPFTNKWLIKDYTEEGYDAWEPTLDPHLWETDQILSLFLQKTTQVDGEGLSEKNEAKVEVLDLNLN